MWFIERNPLCSKRIIRACGSLKGGRKNLERKENNAVLKKVSSWSETAKEKGVLRGRTECNMCAYTQ
jgi:hypothetical protein